MFAVASESNHRVSQRENVTDDLLACVSRGVQGDMGTSLNRCSNVCDPELGKRAETIRTSSESALLLRNSETEKGVAVGLDKDQLVSRSDNVVSVGCTRCVCFQA